MTKHVNIIIATPGRSMEAEYVKSLIKTIQYLNENNITFQFLNQYSSQVNMAREATIMDSRYLDPFNNKPFMGKVTYDKIIWIDSDISWTVQDFIKLYESDKDISSGVYLNEYGIPMFSIEEGFDKDEIKNYLEGSEEFEISANGFGFIAMKNGVFEAMPRPWFEYLFYKIKDDQDKELLVPYGEDYSWCQKAKASGFKIFLNPTVKVGHYKKIGIGIPVETTL